MRPEQHSSPKMQPVPEAPQVPGEQRPREQMLPEQQSLWAEQVPFVGVQEDPPLHTPLRQRRGLTQSPFWPHRTPAWPGVPWQVGAAPAEVPRQ